jgi:Tfp pilus assembly protein PilF
MTKIAALFEIGKLFSTHSLAGFKVIRMFFSIRHRTNRNILSPMCRAFALLTVCQFLCGCQSPLRTEPTVGTPAINSVDQHRLSPWQETNSLSSRQQIATAASLMHAGNLEAAQKQLVEILTANPSDSSAVELLAEVSQKLGDYRLQRASLQRLIALQPSSATVANRCGKRILDSVQMEGSAGASRDGTASPDTISSLSASTALAITSLTNAVKLEPRNTLFAQDLFAALIDQEMDEQAERVLHEALQRNPRDKVLPMTAARLYESREDWSSAVFYYDVALRNDPGNPVWRRHRAVCHFRQGSFEKAQTDFSRSLANSPVKPQLSEHLAWAEAALKTEDHKEASRVLDLIVNEGEYRTAELEVLRGSCLLKQGNFEAAAEVVLQAQLEWPKHAGLWRLAKQIKAAETGTPTIETDRSLDLASLMMQAPLRQLPLP